MPPRLALIGQRFGRLTIVGFVGIDAAGNSQWGAVCDCGITPAPIIGRSLTSGNSNSCGCIGFEKAAETCLRRTRHGNARRVARTPAYNSWRAMKDRCSQPNHTKYSNYGGRGISVCDRWNIFDNFLADMGPRPPKTTLDRYPDNDGDYEPHNCRWATAVQQRANRRDC